MATGRPTHLSRRAFVQTATTGTLGAAVIAAASNTALAAEAPAEANARPTDEAPVLPSTDWDGNATYGLQLNPQQAGLLLVRQALWQALPEAEEAFKERLQDYMAQKGTIRIPCGKVDTDAIQDIARWCWETSNHA